jgi:hypothetical protein
MGETKKSRLSLNFDNSVRLEFHGVNFTSDAGLLACHELDNAPGLSEKSEHYLYDYHPRKNTRRSIVALLRQSMFSRIAGYEDTKILYVTRLLRVVRNSGESCVYKFFY